MSEKYSKKPVELSHLSEEQIDQLIKRYYDGHKVSKLLTEFQIDTIPQKLVGLFPLLIHQDKPCPYCDVPMFTKLSSRNYFSLPPLDSDIVCGSCNHKNLRFCNCDGCRDKEKKKKKDKLKKK